MITSSGSRTPAPTAGLEVRPFRALTYRRRDPEHLARVSSPAYDLVTPAGRARLADADPYNIVRLILPLVDRSALSEDPAEQAADTLHRWISEGVLELDDSRALWVYELRPPEGAPATVGWLGAVALPAPGSTAVLPHEDTYAVAVEGRRALLAATRTDLEPIVLAHDLEPAVTEVTDLARSGVPTLVLHDGDGVDHRLWRVTDPALLGRVEGALRRTAAVIADGHHRFAAARAHALTRTGVAGSDAVLALVTPMGPGGLRVDPIHRVVPELSLDAAINGAGAHFRVTELPPPARADGVRDAADRWLADAHTTGFLVTDGRRVVQLDQPSEVVRSAVPPEAPDAWRRLDVVLAHHGLLAACWGRRDDPESVLIAHSVGEALETAVERNGVALLLRAPSPADVAAVARAGARMPRKSTLFLPKPRTGLVLRPLDG
ncbi:DUF1015 domain-containing protein [Blastococcus sp. PRF04-17]|uniref:DUF1015 domain-containing protein n=1 Tax=Blastococcus sp. PRF04-17 TaxID=2933797 RepID=UPI001FF559EA|nr:DUF1015 domain-containing protein [Blastococcus sp. PRF04-17]UOY02659.1 DUF1015 domain-containing protein [Blastococcus sp. PRF04-17]